MSVFDGEVRGVDIRLGDCLGVMRGMGSGSVDSVVTDPPAGIGFMGKAWDGDRGGRDAWVAWLAERMAEALRVAKPGGHALVWALPRTSHWTALAIEDAGWVIEDRIAHHFGSGFPKHKSKLKPATEDWWLATKPGGKKWLNVDGCRVEGIIPTVTQGVTRRAATGEAIYGAGHGVCRAPQQSNPHPSGRWPSNVVLTHHPDCNGSCVEGCPVAEMDRQSGERPSGSRAAGVRKGGTNWSGPWSGDGGPAIEASSGGASRFFPTFAWEADDFAAFRYVAKASRRERNAGLEGMPKKRSVDDDWVAENRKDKSSGGLTSPQANFHPTVKPLALCRWLVRLVTPVGGTVADPFFGSGTIGLAAIREGFKIVGIESDPDSFSIAYARCAAEAAKGRQGLLFEV